jgi:hypothetical protein
VDTLLRVLIFKASLLGYGRIIVLGRYTIFPPKAVLHKEPYTHP